MVMSSHFVVCFLATVGSSRLSTLIPIGFQQMNMIKPLKFPIQPPPLPERFQRLKQIARKADSGVLMWRSERKKDNEDDFEGPLGQFVSSKKGVIMDFGSDYEYYNACGEPPDDIQTQYLLESSPAAILDLISFVEASLNGMPPSSHLEQGLLDCIDRLKTTAKAASAGPWHWEIKDEDFYDDEGKFLRSKTDLGRLITADAVCALDLGLHLSNSGETMSYRRGSLPSAADTQYLQDASPAIVFDLIIKLKSAQLAPTSPMFQQPLPEHVLELQNAAAAATLGDWRFEKEVCERKLGISVVGATGTVMVFATNLCPGLSPSPEDQRYVEAAHPAAVLALIDEVERAYGLGPRERRSAQS